MDAVLFEQLRPRLTAISSRIVGSDAEAEDIVQDCFLKWRSVDLATLATPAAWLTTVVQHQSIDRLRKRARDAAAHVAAELTPEVAPALPEDELLRRAELGEALARMLSHLSPAERLALVLHEVFECEHADIATALGTRPANARQYLARARRRLRQAAAETDPDCGEKLNRDLVRRFQAAINGMDVPAMVTLLGDGQPLSVRASANDACYRAAA
ncbi:RNA polymerase sigma-70 factor (ECF subfamily) [Duganella sp. SG902]|uniref:sigma-70 family RNA polymerase sigma factor n=1 Tax=Duganella sp. SG902 TaxID=2587016 RepID=UPI00159D0E8A|nr:sigma-70 family RNA polymerase sigma factor [Duganella sp. SG902]NVM77100.1 RNA polymerase sigma-70 factor (ECF subfamily) [Duganella sp. SG902]